MLQGCILSSLCFASHVVPMATVAIVVTVYNSPGCDSGGVQISTRDDFIDPTTCFSVEPHFDKSSEDYEHKQIYKTYFKMICDDGVQRILINAYQDSSCEILSSGNQHSWWATYQIGKQFFQGACIHLSDVHGETRYARLASIYPASAVIPRCVQMDPSISIALKWVGANLSDLAVCQGDCDGDGQCPGDSICVRRSGGAPSAVDGCTIGDSSDFARKDTGYCSNPAAATTSTIFLTDCIGTGCTGCLYMGSCMSLLEYPDERSCVAVASVGLSRWCGGHDIATVKQVSYNETSLSWRNRHSDVMTGWSDSFHKGLDRYTHEERKLGKREPEESFDGCSQEWCTSEGFDLCWGSEIHACTCYVGNARVTGKYADHEGRRYVEYTCCAGGFNHGEDCGGCCTPWALILVCIIIAVTICSIGCGLYCCWTSKCCCFEYRNQQVNAPAPAPAVQYPPPLVSYGGQAIVVGQPVGRPVAAVGGTPMQTPAQHVAVSAPTQPVVAVATPTQATAVQGVENNQNNATKAALRLEQL